jgi:hypothetical protein
VASFAGLIVGIIVGRQGLDEIEIPSSTVEVLYLKEPQARNGCSILFVSTKSLCAIYRS